MVIGVLALLLLLVLVLVGWCIFRFCRKKRPAKKEDKEAADKGEDENVLVDNEEIKDEEVIRDSKTLTLPPPPPRMKCVVI